MFALILIVSLVLNSVKSIDNENVFQCLRKFYENTSGKNWIISTNWATGENPCEFYGIECRENQDGLYDISAISLAGNNLKGVLPECLSSEDFAFDSVDVGGNFLEGPIPAFNPVNIYAVSFKNNNFSSLPSTICEMTKLKFLHADSNKAMAGKKVPDCLRLSNISLPVLSVLSIIDCGLILDEEQETENKIELSIVETLNIGGSVYNNGIILDFHAPKSTIVDLSGCRIKSFGNINNIADFIINAPLAQEIDMQFNNMGENIPENFFDIDEKIDLKLESASPLTVFDISNMNMQQVVLSNVIDLFLKNLPDTLVVVNIKNTKVWGTLPEIEESELFTIAEKKNLIDFNIEGTNIFCNPKIKYSSIKCSNFEIIKNSIQLEHLQIKFMTVTSSEINFNADYFGITVNENDRIIINSIEKIDNTHYIFGSNLLSEEIKSQFYQNQNNFYVTFNDQIISTVFIDNNSIQTTNTKEGEYSNQNYKKLNADNKIDLEVFGFSRCPDYKQIVENLLNPTAIRYPYVFNKVDFKYRTLSKLHERYYTQIWAMHGQVEAMGDIAMLCMQDIFDDHSDTKNGNFNSSLRFLDINLCIYADGLKNIPNNINGCIDKHVSDPKIKEEINTCRFGGLKNERFKKLINKSEERKTSLSSSWSPSLYLNNKLKCLYNAPCETSKPVELAQAICNLDFLSNDKDCKRYFSKEHLY